MTDPDAHGDGPPVFLPEPPRRPADLPEAETPEPQPEHPGTISPGRGQRLDSLQKRRRGMPSPVLMFILVVTLMIAINEGTFFPLLIGFAFFLFLRRRGRS